MSANPFTSPNSETGDAQNKTAQKHRPILTVTITVIYLAGVASTAWVPYLQEFIQYDAWPSYDPNSWFHVFGPSMVATAILVAFAAYLTKRWLIAILMFCSAPILFYQAFIIRLMIYGFLVGINGDWPEVD